MSLEEVELAAVAGLEDVEGGVVSATVGELAVQHQVLDAEARLPSRLLDGVLSLVQQRVMFRVSAWAEAEVELTWFIAEAFQRSVACILWFYLIRNMSSICSVIRAAHCCSKSRSLIYVRLLSR